jgi:hypothetical protein
LLYELRVYEAFAGKLPDLNKRFSDHTLKLFEKHGMKNIGYWTTDVGPKSNALTYMLAFRDANQRMDAWKSFRADPEWQRVFTESHRNGILNANVDNQLLIPTPYSPLQ